MVSKKIVVVGLLVFLSSLSAFAGGLRLAADMNEPVIVDGRLYEGGVLTLRSVARYNPATTFHEVWVGDHCLGLLLARHSRGNSDDTRDTFLFRRDSQGRLVLMGYTLNKGRITELYRFLPSYP